MERGEAATQTIKWVVSTSSAPATIPHPCSGAAGYSGFLTKAFRAGLQHRNVPCPESAASLTRCLGSRVVHAQYEPGYLSENLRLQKQDTHSKSALHAIADCKLSGDA